MERSKYNPWLHRYAIFVAFSTFILIIAGALVTSNDAGLSVPDWPTSFGSFRMPRMVGGILYEHGHRMIAGTVGILTIILAIWLWLKDCRPKVRWLGLVSVGAVVAQAVLGGITVLFYLPVVISVSHATLAQIFFCLNFSLALFTSRTWDWGKPASEDPSLPSLRQLAPLTTAAILVQLILGAAYRHGGIGVVPHMVGASVVSLLIFWMAARVFLRFSSQRRLVRSALLLLGMVLAQVFLGVGAYVEKLRYHDAVQPLPPVVRVTTAHVALGALVLIASLYFTYQTFRAIAPPHPEFASPRHPAPEGARI